MDGIGNHYFPAKGKKRFLTRTACGIAQVAVFLSATCGLSTSQREQEIVNHYNDQTRERYAAYLVDESRYTTKGVDLHRKYYRHLIGIAFDVVERKNLEIEKGSIGFYFDKISGDREKLYLGLDIVTKGFYPQPFESVAVSLVRGHLKDVMETVNACRSVFEERQVVGMVIGWKWQGSGGGEHVNVWIPKEDVVRYEDGMITFSELVQRSSITDTRGRIIRLP